MLTFLLSASDIWRFEMTLDLSFLLRVGKDTEMMSFFSEYFVLHVKNSRNMKKSLKE